MKLLDTNFIVRFLLNDSPKQAETVEQIFKKSFEELILTDVVFAEITYVLQSVYKLSKEETIDKLYQLMRIPAIIYNRELISKTLITYLNNNISFVDAYLAAYCEQNNLEGIYSFDKGLDKIKSVKRLKP